MLFYESFSEEDTFQIGRQLAERAKTGDIFLLEGDLGVGKTVLAKGFAVGLGVSEPITSPTFTIVQEYEGGRLPFYHFDAYRIEDAEEMYEIGCEAYFFGEGVCLIEWASRIRDILPKDCCTVRIEKEFKKGFDYRRITMEGPVG